MNDQSLFNFSPGRSRTVDIRRILFEVHQCIIKVWHLDGWNSRDFHSLLRSYSLVVQQMALWGCSFLKQKGGSETIFLYIILLTLKFGNKWNIVSRIIVVEALYCLQSRNKHNQKSLEKVQKEKLVLSCYSVI